MIIFKPAAQNCKQDTKVENGEITGPTPYISPGSKVLIQCDQGYIENRVDIRCVTLDEFSFSSSADFSRFLMLCLKMCLYFDIFILHKDL